MTTEERLRSLLEAATPGPWHVHDECCSVIYDSVAAGSAHIAETFAKERRFENRALIIETVNALPKLLAVLHAAADVDGLWFPQDDNETGSDLTFWGPEAGEALRDLRTAVKALDEP